MEAFRFGYFPDHAVVDFDGVVEQSVVFLKLAVHPEEGASLPLRGRREHPLEQFSCPLDLARLVALHKPVQVEHPEIIEARPREHAHSLLVDPEGCLEVVLLLQLHPVINQHLRRYHSQLNRSTVRGLYRLEATNVALQVDEQRPQIFAQMHVLRILMRVEPMLYYLQRVRMETMRDQHFAPMHVDLRKLATRQTLRRFVHRRVKLLERIGML